MVFVHLIIGHLLYFQDQYEFVHLVISEMLMTHLKNNGFDEKNSKSNLMKSLGESTYENIEVLQKTPVAVSSCENITPKSSKSTPTGKGPTCMTLRGFLGPQF